MIKMNKITTYDLIAPFDVKNYINNDLTFMGQVISFLLILPVSLIWYGYYMWHKDKLQIRDKS